MYSRFDVSISPLHVGLDTTVPQEANLMLASQTTSNVFMLKRLYLREGVGNKPFKSGVTPSMIYVQLFMLIAKASSSDNAIGPYSNRVIEMPLTSIL